MAGDQMTWIDVTSLLSAAAKGEVLHRFEQCLRTLRREIHPIAIRSLSLLTGRKLTFYK